MTFNKIGIAKRLILAEKFEKAKLLLRQLAKRNISEAQLILGYLYYGGDEKTTSKDSEYWLRKSAKNGNAEALALIASTNFKLGLWSSEPETNRSLSLTFKAARKGSAEAQRSLACAYAHGDVVDQDDVKTMYWDEKAAKQGLAESQNDLALMLLHGIGREPDTEQAIYWYTESASKDYNAPYSQWAAEALARIYSGKPDKQLSDKATSDYWDKRAKHLSTLEGRIHPNWFYN